MQAADVVGCTSGLSGPSRARLCFRLLYMSMNRMRVTLPDSTCAYRSWQIDIERRRPKQPSKARCDGVHVRITRSFPGINGINPPRRWQGPMYTDVTAGLATVHGCDLESSLVMQRNTLPLVVSTLQVLTMDSGEDMMITGR